MRRMLEGCPLPLLNPFCEWAATPAGREMLFARAASSRWSWNVIGTQIRLPYDAEATPRFRKPDRIHQSESISEGNPCPFFWWS